ncbi:hypothetical protein AAIG33_09145 [Phytobacter ursingii]|uniref:hypothetical protein n=1 Tax=Phytobacter ursingii TaxID=1972431 RepID=UPI000CD305B2|nr:hypothetical protein C2U51_10495 [Enterobacteriaceae bacterium ENNIH1]RDT52564.1 hypothetical protein DXF93_21225 [Escherichia coli]
MADVFLLLREPWDYDIYSQGSAFVITVVFSEYNLHSQMDVFRSFILSKETLIQYGEGGNLSALANKVRETWHLHIWKEVKPHIFIAGKDTVAKYKDSMTLIASVC